MALLDYNNFNTFLRRSIKFYQRQDCGSLFCLQAGDVLFLCRFWDSGCILYDANMSVRFT